MLFGLWVLSRLQNGFQQLLPQLPLTQALINTLQLIENINDNNYRQQWNLAKEAFIRDIMINKPKVIRRAMNFCDDEHSNFIEPLKDFQTYNVRQICTAGCRNDGAILGQREFIIYLNKSNNNVYLDFLWQGNCNICNVLISIIPEFINITPNFLTIEPVVGSRILFHEMPDVLNISNRRYKLLLASINDRARRHYIGILKINNNEYYTDSIPREVEDFPPFDRSYLQTRSIDDRLIKAHTMPVTAALYYLD